ncbi:hypothetical protein P4S72_18315 [Vibrio sp. PP-XX7]
MTFLWHHSLSPESLERIAYFSWKLKDTQSLSRLEKVLTTQLLSPTLAQAWVYVSYAYQQQANNGQSHNEQARLALIQAKKMPRIHQWLRVK